MVGAERMKSSQEIRVQIDAALAAGQLGRALAQIKQLWFADPSLANAPFVEARLSKCAAVFPRTECNLLILRSFTVEPLVPLLRATAACWGVDLSVRLGQFNSYVQEILDPHSTLYQEPTDVVVIAPLARDLAPELWSKFSDLAPPEIEAVIDRVVGGYRVWLDTIRSRTDVHIVIHNLEIPSNSSAGIYDAQAAGGQSQVIQRINRELVSLASAVTGCYVLDYEGLVSRHGRESWGDEKKWLTARLPLAGNSLIRLTQEWMRFLAPLSGKQAKCLVCDLDNTLWGGVIGEDGLAGIKLGADYPGAAYQALQRTVLDLSRRGILLAICSKNNEADALEAIQQHPGMLLRREDFAAIRINWHDKAANLREIAAELNIGIDSLVFLDDNPVEREFVREMLPELTVIDIDAANPFGHATAVRQCPLFERLALSAEDRERTKLYAAQEQRTALASSAATLEDYYRSLEMVAEFGEVDAVTLERVAQLTQKTNQLNMTTRRYSEQDILRIQSEPSSWVTWVRVLDRFGDNGIVGVMIVHEQGKEWELDTFLMSCRVIGRTVETAMLAHLVSLAQQRGMQTLRGPFVSTAKNAPAKEIYASHGFRCEQTGDKESLWVLDLGTTLLATPEWIECRVVDQLGVKA